MPVSFALRKSSCSGHSLGTLLRVSMNFTQARVSYPIQKMTNQKTIAWGIKIYVCRSRASSSRCGNGGLPQRGIIMKTDTSVITIEIPIHHLISRKLVARR